MTHLLLVAHSPLATSLKAVAQHVFPDCAATLQALDVDPADSPDQVEEWLRSMMPAGEVLLMADVFGATPCNAALRVADGVRAKVVAGVNVPMLWRVLCYAGEPLEALAGRAVAGATQGVMQLACPRPQNQPAKRGPDDQVQPHHQQ